MKTKVYMLLNISDKKSTEVAEVLRRQTGVIIADVVEGPPDIVMVVEVSDRRKLADRAIKDISSVEDMIDNIKLLPITIGSMRWEEPCVTIFCERRKQYGT